MNETAQQHAQYVVACGLAVDAAEAGAAAKAAWRKLQSLERKASELYAAAMHAHQQAGAAKTAEGLKKASRKHWRAQYVAEAGFQDIYEDRDYGRLDPLDLLAAIKRLLAHHEAGDDYDATSAAEAAIARAEGRSK